MNKSAEELFLIKALNDNNISTTIEKWYKVLEKDKVGYKKIYCYGNNENGIRISFEKDYEEKCSSLNIDKTFDSIQGYFSSDPDEVKAIKEYLIKEADRVKKDSIYQAFYPLKLLENHQHNSFTVEGLLKTMTGNIAMEEKKARINFNYRVNNKKLVIKSFEVIK